MKYRNIFFSIFISFIFLVYCFNLTTSFIYHPDFARDIYEILNILQGKLTLIGPRLTFGGLYAGPYYFYLFVPVFFLTKSSITSLLFFNAALFAAALIYFFKKMQETFPTWKTALATSSIALLPVYLNGARYPSNAYTFLPILLVLLTSIYFNFSENKNILFLWGITLGIIVNFHFVNLILVPSIFIIVFYLLKNKRNAFFLIFGFLVTFLPLLFFEARHNFVIFTNTFINKSYLSWLQNKNLPGTITGSQFFLKNLFFMSGQMQPVNPALVLILSLEYFILKKPEKRSLIFYATSLFGLAFFSYIMRFQFLPYYLAGLTVFLFFTVIVVLLRARLIIFLLFIIFVEILYFPKEFYSRSWRSPEAFQKVVQYVIQKNLVKKNEHFNIIQITERNLKAPAGFEYRFFFKKYGYHIDSEFTYNSSTSLLIFSEPAKTDLSKFDSWEIRQFGKKNFRMVKKYKTDFVTIYKISKL